MKKGKYIDYNILLACLSKRPQATITPALVTNEERDILQEFYDTLAVASRSHPGRQTVIANIGELCCQ